MIKEYRAYLNDNPEGYWFKRKLYGWGWTPTKWQGWFVILVFIGFLILNAFRFDPGPNPSDAAVIPFILETFFIVFILIFICFKKGEKPSWQWGLPDKYKKK